MTKYVKYLLLALAITAGGNAAVVTHTIGPVNWYDVITSTVTYTYDGTTVTWTVVNTAPGYAGGGGYDVSLTPYGNVQANYPGGGAGPWQSTQTGSHVAAVGQTITAISGTFAWVITAPPEMQTNDYLAHIMAILLVLLTLYAVALGKSYASE